MREQIAQQTPLKRRASAEQYTLSQRMQSEPQTDEEEVPDSYYDTRRPTSARRYYDTRGNQVIQRGNPRIVIREEPPPKRRKNHVLLYIGIGMLLMVLGWISLQLLGNWWTNYQLNSTYQYPRIYQASEVVGHADSTDHPSNFIFENLHGQVLIIEFPGGDYAHARIYKGPMLFSDSADQIPVTAEFKDVNGDGKVDIVLHIQDQRIVFFNTGTGFKAQ